MNSGDTYPIRQHVAGYETQAKAFEAPTCINMVCGITPLTSTMDDPFTFYLPKTLTTFVIYNHSKSDTEIATGAFMNVAIEQIIFNTIDTIDDYAFYNAGTTYDSDNKVENQLKYIGTSIQTIGDEFVTRIEFADKVTNIGAYAFSNIDSISKVTINSHIAYDETNEEFTIGSYAFSNMNSLNNVDIKNDQISAHMFDMSTNLTNVKIPNTVEYIGDYAFANSALADFDLYNTLVGNYMFANNDSLTAVVVDDCITLMGKGAFADCNGITSITLPFVGAKRVHGLTNNETDDTTFGYIFAFDGYNDLYNITNDRNVAPDTSSRTLAMVIADSADEAIFYKVTQNGNDYYLPVSLTTVTITDDTAIKDYAFEDVRKVTTLTIPEGYHTGDTLSLPITSIGAYAFNGMIALSHINYNTESGKNELPETIKTIGAYAFCDTHSLREITLPSALESLGEGAFKTTDTTSSTLEEVNFTGDKLSVLETDLFYNAINLKKMNFTYGTGVNKVEFKNTSTSEIIYVLDSIEVIKNNVFYNNTSIKNVIVPKSVQTMGSSVFSGATALTTLELPFVGEHRVATNSADTTTFGYIFGYNEPIARKDSNNKDLIYKITQNGNEYNIPTSLKTVIITDDNEIKAYAFQDLREVTTLNIPTGYNETYYISKIGAYAFEGMTLLQNMNKSGNNNVLPSTITEIGDCAFMNATSITNITLPTSLSNKDNKEGLGISVFENATSLEEVYYDGNNLTTLKNRTFYNAYKLKTFNVDGIISLPESITTINDYVFFNAEDIEHIVLTNSVTSIGKSILGGASSLVSIKTPFIGNAIAEACTVTKDQTTNEDLGIIDNKTRVLGYFFSEKNDTVNTLHDTTVGAFNETSQIYDSTDITKRYVTMIPATLTDITVTNSAVIHVGAFSNVRTLATDKLTTVTFENSQGATKINVIEDYAFYMDSDITNNKNVVVNGDMTSLAQIGRHAFENSKIVKFNSDINNKAVLPDSLTTIKDYAFYNTNNINNLYIDRDLDVVGSYVFAEMDTLATVSINNAYVGDHMFFNDTQISEITVPTYAESIGYAAFGGMTGLTKLTVPFIGSANNEDSTYNDSGNKVLGYLFGKYTDNPTTLVPQADKITQHDIDYAIPSSLKTLVITVDNIISSNALQNTVLNKVVFDTVSEIGSYAFNNMDSLQYVGYDENHALDNTIEFITAALVASRNEANANSENPDTNVTRREFNTIGAYAFENVGMIQTLTINDSIQKKNVGANNTVTYTGTIGDYAFANMPQLANLTINNTVIGNHMFDGSTSLHNITIEEEVDLIGAYAFANSGLSGFTLKNHLIGEYMFYNNNSLQTVIVPNNINTIGYAAFGECSNISSMTVPYVGAHMTDNDNTNNIENLFGYIFGHKANTNTTMKPIKQTDGVTNSYEAPVERELSAQSASTYETINKDSNGMFTFYVPANLTSVTITSKKEATDTEAADTIISYGAFMNFDMIQNVTLNSNLVNIGEAAFKNAEALVAIFIPNTVAEIGESAFENTYQLQSVEFEAGNIVLTTIPAKAFKNAIILSTIKSENDSTKNQFPAGIDTISSDALYGTDISLFYVSNKVTSIGSGAFAKTDSLQSIELPFVGEYRHAEHSDDTTTFGYIFATTEELTNNNAFYQATQNGNTYYLPVVLTSVTINDDDVIKAYAFQNANRITTIRIPVGYNMADTNEEARNPIHEIGAYAFEGMFNSTANTGLASIKSIEETSELNILPDSIDTIGEYAFGKATGRDKANGLTNITLPKSLGASGLGQAAFRNSTALATVNFTGRSLNTLANSTFENCSNLQDMTYIDKVNNKVEAQSGKHGVYIVDTIQAIGNYVFFNNGLINTLVIPSSVDTIGTSVLGGTNNLKNLTIPFVGKDRQAACVYTGDDKHVIDSSEYVFGYLFGKEENNASYNAYGSLTPTEQICGAETVNDSVVQTKVTYNLSNVENVTITDTTTLHYGAFSNVTSLQTVVFEPVGSVKLTTVEDYAFYNTSALVSVTGDLDSLVALGNSAFENSTIAKFKSETNGMLNLPESIDHIMDKVFYNANNITSVSIPVGVLTIGDYAFAEMDTLETVDYRALLVGSHMFYNDTEVAELVIPKDAGSIGYAAFGGMTGLQRLSVPFIGSKDNLTSNYGDTKVLGYFFGNATLATDNTLTEPSEVDTINQNGTDYNIPKSLATVVITDDDIVSDYAFANTHVKQVVLTNTNEIGAHAFENMDYVRYVGYTENTYNDLMDDDFVKTIEFNDGINITIGAYAFNEIGSITKVVVNESVANGEGKTVGDYAFSNMSSLNDLTISNQYVSSYMFANDISVADVKVPSNALSIGYAAFSGMTGLNRLEVPFVGRTYNYDTTANLEATEKVLGYFFGTVQNSSSKEYDVEEANTTFYIPTSLATVVVTNDTILSNDAFKNATHVTSITLPNGNTNKFNIIGEYAVANTGISEFVIPSTVGEISSYSFYNNADLAKVTYLGNSIDTIDSYAFANNPKLATFVNSVDNTANVINIPTSVTTIEAHAFENSISDSTIDDINVILPTGLKGTLGEASFKNTAMITNVEFNNCELEGVGNLTAIGAYAFENSGIQTFGVGIGASRLVNTFGETINTIGAYAFNNTKLHGSLTIPVKITNIGDYAFSNITSKLTNISYKSNVIGKHMFENDSNITTVGFDTTTLTVIEDYAFKNTTSLDNIKLPEELVTLGVEAFNNSKLGDTTTLPKGLVNINKMALANNEYTVISVPDSVRYIGYAAFSGNGSLKEMTLPFIGSYHPNFIPENYTVSGSETLFGYIFGREQYTDGVEVTQFMKKNGEIIKFYNDATPERELVTSETFYIPTGLVKVEISEHTYDQINRIKEITSGQFSGITTLHNVVLPYRLETIRESAFSGATGLYYIDIPETVMTLERAVFENINPQFFIIVYYSLEWEAANPDAEEPWRQTASIINHIRPKDWFYNVDENNKPITEDSAWYTHYIVHYDEAYNIFRYEYNYSNTKSTWTIIGYYEDALKAYVAAHRATDNGNQFILPIPGARGGHDVVEITANAFYDYFEDYCDSVQFSIDGLDIAPQIEKIGANAVYGTDSHQLNIYIRNDKKLDKNTNTYHVYNEENWIAGNALVYYGYNTEWVKNDYYYQVMLGNTDVTQIELSTYNYEYRGVNIEPTTVTGILDPISQGAYQPETLTVISTATKIGDAVRPTFTIGTHFKLEYENNFHASNENNAVVRVVEIQTDPFFAKNTYRDIEFTITKAPILISITDEMTFEEGTYWTHDSWANKTGDDSYGHTVTDKTDSIGNHYNIYTNILNDNISISGFKNQYDTFAGNLSINTVLDFLGLEETPVKYANGEVLPYTDFSDFFWRQDWSVINTEGYGTDMALTDDYYLTYDLEVLIKQKEILVYWSNTSVEHSDNLTLPTPKVYIKEGYDPLEVVPLTIDIYDEGNNHMGTQMNIGSYTVYASTTNTNYKLVGYKSSYEIDKKTISLPSMNNRIVYDGNDQAVLLSPADHFDYWMVEGFERYTDPENQTLIKITDVTQIKLRNAGTYYVYAIIGEQYSMNYQWRYYIDELYREPSYELEMIVNQRDLFIKIDNKEVKITDGEIKFPIEASMVSNLIDGDSVSGFLSVDGTTTGYHYSNEINTDNLVINNKDGKPGNYKIQIDATINVVYPNIADVTTVEDYNEDYDGDPEGHTIKITLNSEIADATIQYSRNGNDWSTTPIKFTDAGEYSVYYKITREGYNEMSGIAAVIINPIYSDVTIDQVDNNKEFDGTNFDIAYTYTEGLDGALPVSVEYYRNGSTAHSTTAVNAGDWVAVVVVDGNGNYKETRVEFPFTITPKTNTNALIAFETGYRGDLGRYSYITTESNKPTEHLIDGDTFYIEFTINETPYVMATGAYSEYSGKTFYNKTVSYNIVTFDENRVYEANKYYSFVGTEYILIEDETMPSGDIYERTEEYIEVQLDSTSYHANEYYVERESAVGTYRYSDGDVFITTLMVMRGSHDVTYDYDLDTLISEFVVTINRSKAEFRYSGTLFDDAFLKIYDESPFDGASIIKMASNSSKPIAYYYFSSEEDALGNNGIPDLTKAISAPVDFGTYYVRCYVEGDFNTKNGWSDVYKVNVEKRKLETWATTTVFEYTGEVIMPTIKIREYTVNVPLTYNITSGNGITFGDHVVTVSLTTPNENYILDEDNSVYPYTINQRKVTIRISDDVDYVSDSTVWSMNITNTKAKVINLADNQTISGIIKTKSGKVGTYSTANKFDYSGLAISDSNNIDVTSNYEFTLNITVKIFNPYVNYTVTNGEIYGFEANKYYFYDGNDYILIESDEMPEGDLYSAEYSYEEIEVSEDNFVSGKYYTKNSDGEFLPAVGEYADYIGVALYEQSIGYTKIKYNKYKVSYVYDGLAHPAIVTPESGATVTYVRGGRSTIAPVSLTDVGTVDIVFKIAKKDCRPTEGVITLEITPAEHTISPTFTDEFDSMNKVVTKAYSATQFEFTYSILDKNGLPVRYAVESNVAYYRPGVRTYKLPTPSRIGEYEVVITIPETQNYAEATYEFTLIIESSEVPINIAPEQLTTTYSGFPVVNPYVNTYSRYAKVIYEYFELTENGRVSLGHTPVLNVGTYELDVTVEGEYEVYYKKDDQGEYILENGEKVVDYRVAIGFTDSTETYSFTVTPLSRVVTWKNTSNTYGNKENLSDYIPIATFNDAYGNPHTADVTTNMTFIKAGEYTAVATSTDPNYYIPEGKNSISFKVNKRTAQVVYRNDYYEYTGSPASITISSNNTEEIEVATNLRSGDVLTLTLTTSGFAVGEYRSANITLSNILILDSEGRDVTASYNDLTKANRANIKIRKKPIVITFDNTNVTQFGNRYVIKEEFDPTGNTSHVINAHASGDCEIIYIINNVEYTSFPTEGFSKVGSYEIEYRAESLSGGYESQTGTFVLEVLPIKYDMRFKYPDGATSYDKVYDELAVLPSVEVTNYTEGICDNSKYYAQYKYYGFDNNTEEYYELFTYSPVTFNSSREYEANKYYRFNGVDYELITDAVMPTDGTIYLREPVRSVTNAGKYKVEATIPTGVNYKETTISTEFTISKANVVIVPYAEKVIKNNTVSYIINKVFNAQEVTLVNNENSSPITGDYEYYGEGEVIVSYIGQEAGFKPYYAGDYEFKFIVEETENFKAYDSITYIVSIAKMDVIFAAPAQTTSYTGTNYAMASVTISHNTLGLELIGDIICKEVEMGTYGSDGTNAYDHFSFATNAKLMLGDKNVIDSINPLFNMTLTIEGASAESHVSYVGLTHELVDEEVVTTETNSLEFTYDGKAHSLGIKITGITGGYKIIYSLQDMTDMEFDISNMEEYITDLDNSCSENSYQFINAGTYTVYYIITFDNYQTIRGSKVITIARKDVTTLTISSINREYNRKPIDNPIVTTDSDGAYSFEYYNVDALGNIVGDPISNPINAGNYKVKVILAQGTNYNYYDKLFDVVISKYQVRLVWGSLEVQYTGSEITPEVEFSKPLPDTTVVLGLTARIGDTPAVILERADYIVTAVLTGEASENYEFNNGEKTFKVVKRIIVLPADMTEVYTGKDLNPYNSNLYTRSINEFINAGTYNVTLSLVDSDSYTWELEDGTLTTADQTVKFIIAPMDITYNEIVKSDIIKLYNNTLVINPITNQSYDKNNLSEPIPVIIYNGVTLVTKNPNDSTAPYDLVVEYENNDKAYDGINPSYVIVTGKDGGNYTGSIRFEFKIISLLFTLANENNTIKFTTYRNGKYSVSDQHTVSGSGKKEYITNFRSDQTIEQFLTMFEENQRDLIVVLNTKNTPITDRTSRIISGYKIVLKDTDDNVKDSLIIAIHGDVNCDGVVNSVDYTLLRNYISGKAKLTDAAYVAGDINNDGVVNSIDFVLLANKISGSSDYESEYIQ